QEAGGESLTPIATRLSLEDPATPAEALWTVPFIRITLTQFLLFCGFLMLLPVVPLYLSRFTSHEGVIGGTVGLFTFSAFLARIWFGPLVDLTGRRRVLLAGLLWFAACCALYAATASVLSVAVVRVLHGLGFAAAMTALGAMAADVIPPVRRGEGMGFYGSGENVAQAFMPVVGFAIVGLWGFAAVFYLSSLTVVAAWVLAGFQPETGTPDPSPARQKKVVFGLESQALLPAFLALVISFVSGAVFVLMPLYAIEYGMTNPGPFYTGFALSVLLLRAAAGAVADRHGAVPMIAGGLVLQGFGLAAIGFWPAAFAVFMLPGGIMAGAVLMGLGIGILVPITHAVAIARSPRERWGAAGATYLAGNNLGIGLGAFLLGSLGAVVGLDIMYRWSVLGPLAGLIYLLYTRDGWYVRKPVIESE
ncbi:MAG: MFS transporter, partial [Thermaerobacterales bacterium]